MNLPLNIIPVEPEPNFIESSGRWFWPIPEHAQSPNCSTAAVTASREWWEYVPDEGKPHPKAEGVRLCDGKWYWVFPFGLRLPGNGFTVWTRRMGI